MRNKKISYDPQAIESKWQKIWEDSHLYETDIKNAKKPFYNLWMFPYPSGARMHVGHAYASTGSDIVGRFMRMFGRDVFQPMGFDAFGIHGENYAIKVGKHPSILMEDLCDRFRDEQFKRIGHGYDWSKEVRTYRPEYYKWTQWIFLQLYKNGLAERKEANVNWCPSCKTVLADEQVISGECERCHTKVEQKVLKQWFFKITDFAEKLLLNLDRIDWSKKVVEAQRNWIGKSEGASIKFKVQSSKFKSNSKLKIRNKDEEYITVFTTRPDTIFGATYLVLSPEHPLVSNLTVKARKSEVTAYVKQAGEKTEIERVGGKREKTGVFTGSYAINPANGDRMPIWVADYVLTSYGTGAIMAVPAHDARDWDFAERYGLPIKKVIEPVGATVSSEGAFEGYGKLIDSGEFSGMSSEKAIKKICVWLEDGGLGGKAVTYRLRDWLISRQRYWSAPIPIIYCKKCGAVPVPDKDLPVRLPFVKDWKPKGDGRGPLANIPDFVNTTCPKCGGPARRETDTLDNFLDSGWYFFRYPFADRGDVAFDAKSAEFKKWFPVHLYIGGAEHSVLHLMYTRFLTMAFHKIGLIDFDEPFVKFFAHGHITKDGKKMSKSLGNTVNPDDYIKKVGADAFRIYLMFLGPYRQGGDFTDAGLSGMVRFLNRFWNLCLREKRGKSVKSGEEVLAKLNVTIKKVGEDIQKFKFNTAIASLMEFVNEWEKGTLALDDVKKAVKLLAPFAPFMAEEVWHILGGEYSIHKQAWPEYNPSLLKADVINVSVQINGKLGGVLEVPNELAGNREAVEKMAFRIRKVKGILSKKKVGRVIFVPGKTINFVID